MKASILSALYEADGYVSGQQLCDKLGCIPDCSLESHESVKRRRLCDRIRASKGVSDS